MCCDATSWRGIKVETHPSWREQYIVCPHCNNYSFWIWILQASSTFHCLVHCHLFPCNNASHQSSVPVVWVSQYIYAHRISILTKYPISWNKRPCGMAGQPINTQLLCQQRENSLRGWDASLQDAGCAMNQQPIQRALSNALSPEVRIKGPTGESGKGTGYPITSN